MIKKLEEKVMELNNKLPQLPTSTQVSLARFFWILAILAIVLNVMGIIAVLGIGAISNLVLFSTGFGYMTVNIWIMVITGVIGMGITVVMELIALKPLKAKKYRGWYISFCAVWLGLIFSIIYDIFSHSFGSIFQSVIRLAISLYLLAQVRDHFTSE